MHLFLRIIVLLICIPLFTAQIFAHKSNQRIQSWNAKQPSRFTENKGQITDQNGNLRNDVKYIYSAPGFKAIFKANSFSYEVFTVEKKPKQENISEATGKAVDESLLPEKFKKPEDITIRTNRIDIELSGANKNPQIIAEGKSSDYSTFYASNINEVNSQNIYCFSRITYKNVWPKIDIVFYAKNNGELKYDIKVNAGGKISDIKMVYNGAGDIGLTANKLCLSTLLGNIEESIPLSYIAESNEKLNIHYSLNKNTVRFAGKYNKNKTLVIDPELKWSTYYGGTDGESSNAICSDNRGNVYFGGSTEGSNNLATGGTYQTTSKGKTEAFIAKFDSAGKRIWATYYGGIDRDYLEGMVCDDSSNIYFVGYTESADYIATPNAYQSNKSPNSSLQTRDAYLVKMNAKGKRQWSTYYGGDEDEMAFGIAYDKAGFLYISGMTTSNNYISTSSAHQKVKGGKEDAFLAKFDTSGAMQWATYFGGSNNEWGLGTMIDETGNVYLYGSTESFNAIATNGAYKEKKDSMNDAFVAKFSNTGKIIWATYYGGSGNEQVSAMGQDNAGNIYITGFTESYNNIATPNSHQSQKDSANDDAYLAKFSKDGMFQWGTYYGGNSYENGTALATDLDGFIYVAGYTASSNKIAYGNAIQQNLQGYSDVFLTKFDTTGKIIWGTYYGGSGLQNTSSMAISSDNCIYISGSTDLGFPVKKAFQSFNRGYNDAFVIKFKILPDIALAPANSFDSLACNNDTLRLAFLLRNIYQAVEKVKIKVLLIGADTLMLADSVNAIMANTNTVLTVKSMLHTNKTGNYKLIAFISSPNENKINDTFKSSVTFFSYAKPDFKVLTSCSDTTISFLNNSSSCSGISSYEWDFGDGSKSTLEKPVKHTYNNFGSYNVKLVVKTSFGADSAIKTVYYYPAPKADFDYASDCSNHGVTFNNKSTIVQGSILSYNWNFGDGKSSILKNPIHTYSAFGNYEVKLKVKLLSGCEDSVIRIINIDSFCVWPGDADANKIVNNIDILALGVAFGSTGPARPDTATAWEGHYTQNWSNNLASGKNYKHADSNGDGIVSNTDTMAITRNYTKTHAKKEHTNRGKNTDPLLKIEIQNDSLNAGDTLVAYIILGENALPAKDAYGIAFSLSYDEISFSAPLVDFTGSWLGTGGIAYSNTTNGLDLAITRTDQKNVSGAGKIAAIRLILKKDVQVTKDFKLGITDNVLISANEQQIPVNVEDDSVRVYKDPNSIYTDKIQQPTINVYPNPFSDKTIIEYELLQPGKVGITLYDITGRSQLLMPSTKQLAGKHQFILDSKEFKIASGMHLIQLEVNGIPTNKRVVKVE